MKSLIRKAYKEDDGMLSFEWVLLLTLLTVGVVAGITGARDAIISEFGDVAEGTVCINQGYQLDPVIVDGQTLAQGSFYQDEFPDVVVDRQTLSDQQDPENEN